MNPLASRSRALTLVEMMVALSLLSGLMLAVVSWTQAAARSGAELAGPHAWRCAAERVIGLIHDDLQSGDWQPQTDDRKELPRRVMLEDGELTIRTRHDGPATHRYQFEASRNELAMKVQTMDGASAPLGPRLLLEQVKDWTCIIEEFEEPVPARRLSIAITGDDGTTIVRTFRLEDDA